MEFEDPRYAKAFYDIYAPSLTDRHDSKLSSFQRSNDPATFKSDLREGSYDPMTEWRLREREHNESLLADMKARSGLQQVHNPTTGHPERWRTADDKPPLESTLDDYTINVATPIGPLSYGSSTSSSDKGLPPGYTKTTNRDALSGSVNLARIIQQYLIRGEMPPEWALKAYGNYSKTKERFINTEGQTEQKRFTPQFSAGVEYTDPKGFRVRGSASDDTRRELYGVGVDAPVGDGILSGDITTTRGDRLRNPNTGDLYSPNEWRAMLEYKMRFGKKTGGMVRNPYPYEPKTI